MLTNRYSRRLITMEKVRRYDAAEAALHHAQTGAPTLSIDRLHDVVYEQRTPSSGSLAGAAGAAGPKRFRSKVV